MTKQLTIILAFAAMVAVNSVTAFGQYGMGYGGIGGGAPAVAANIDSARATGHAIAAENRATEAAIDRATGNPIGAAINENSAIGQSMASNMAAGRSTIEAGMAGGMGGSGVAALGANIAAGAATNAAAGAASGGAIGGGIGAGLGYGGIGGPLGYGGYGIGGFGGYGVGGYGVGGFGVGGYGYPGAFPFAGYGYPYGSNLGYKGVGLRDYLMNDPALRMQREVSRTRVYW